MKTVLFVIDSLTCGGAEKSLISLLPFLDYSALDVDLMIVKRGGVYEKFVPDRVHVISVPKAPQWLFRFYQSFFSLEIRVLRLFGICRHSAETYWQRMSRAYLTPVKKYDVAVAYQQGFPTYYVATKVRAKRKWAWVNADMEKAGYRSRFNRPLYDQINGVCAVSEALSCILVDAGFVSPEKIRVINDILNVAQIRKMADEPLDTFNGSARFKILTVGRLVPPKNYPLAVEAADILRDKGVDFVWTFIGEGRERSKIETLIQQKGLQKHVFLARQKLNPYHYFKACDIYVQTSSFEGFGLTISEAKVFHKPIVTTNFPAAHDQIKDGENGLIAEMTADSLANKILSILENPDLKDMLVNGTRMEENRTAETEIARANSLLLED